MESVLESVHSAFCRMRPNIRLASKKGRTHRAWERDACIDRIRWKGCKTVNLVILFIVFLVTPPLRDFYGLTLLRQTDHYLLIVLAVIVWLFVLRFVWRAQLFERYLNID